MSRILGTVACVVGLCGVITTVLAHHVIDRTPERPPGWSFEAKFSEKLKLRAGTLPAEEPRTDDRAR